MTDDLIAWLREKAALFRRAVSESDLDAAMFDAAADALEALREAIAPLVEAYEANAECPPDDPDESRIWIIQAYGAQLHEITADELEAASLAYHLRAQEGSAGGEGV